MASGTSTRPNYAWWAARPLWTLYEAACLLSDIDPPPIEKQEILPSILSSGPPKERYADLKSACIDLNEIPYMKRLPTDPQFMYRVEPYVCIAWAKERKYPIPEELIKSVCDVSKAVASEQPLKENERKTLLKQIGCLALLLAEKSSRYTVGKNPNAYQIANDVLGLVEGMQDINRRGLGCTSLRTNISEGIELLKK